MGSGVCPQHLSAEGIATSSLPPLAQAPYRIKISCLICVNHETVSTRLSQRDCLGQISFETQVVEDKMFACASVHCYKVMDSQGRCYVCMNHRSKIASHDLSLRPLLVLLHKRQRFQTCPHLFGSACQWYVCHQPLNAHTCRIDCRTQIETCLT